MKWTTKRAVRYALLVIWWRRWKGLIIAAILAAIFASLPTFAHCQTRIVKRESVFSLAKYCRSLDGEQLYCLGYLAGAVDSITVGSGCLENITLGTLQSGFLLWVDAQSVEQQKANHPYYLLSAMLQKQFHCDLGLVVVQK